MCLVTVFFLPQNQLQSDNKSKSYGIQSTIIIVGPTPGRAF
jgi:hypothetical protein